MLPGIVLLFSDGCEKKKNLSTPGYLTEMLRPTKPETLPIWPFAVLFYNPTVFNHYKLNQIHFTRQLSFHRYSSAPSTNTELPLRLFSLMLLCSHYTGKPSLGRLQTHFSFIFSLSQSTLNSHFHDGPRRLCPMTSLKIYRLHAYGPLHSVP